MKGPRQTRDRVRLLRVPVISTLHLPATEREKIEQLIRSARRDDTGRIMIEHPGVSIEPFAFGFLAYAGDARCSDLPALEALLKRMARDHGAGWVLFDDDEPPVSDLEIHDDRH